MRLLNQGQGSKKVAVTDEEAKRAAAIAQPQSRTGDGRGARVVAPMASVTATPASAAGTVISALSKGKAGLEIEKKQAIEAEKRKIPLKDLTEINIILGRNGCGKSRILQAFYRDLLKGKRIVRYVPPERGFRLGTTKELSDKEVSIEKNETGKNEELDFRLRSLEGFLSPLAPIIHGYSVRQLDKKAVTEFENIINSILENITVKIAKGSSNPTPGSYNATLNFFLKNTQQPISYKELSSGETELISLWAELLRFQEFYRNHQQQQDKFLLLDEPDLHLHPDTQSKLAKLIFEMTQKFNSNNSFFRNKLKVILVTHSTSILSSLSKKPGVSVCFLKKEDEFLNFIPLGDGFGIKSNQAILGAALPIFGAHPLTQIFNKKPILLVEGIDEEWVWQQAIRSSRGTLKIYPCSVDGESNMAAYEERISSIIGSVYNQPRGYSLRGRGDTPEKSLGVKIIRNLRAFKLHCRSSKNLLLSDEVLDRYGITFKELIEKINIWIEECVKKEKSPFLQKTLTIMKDFRKSNYNRKTFDIKEIIEHLLFLIREISTKSSTNPKLAEPWQVAVGSVIGQLILGKDACLMISEDSIVEYLGIDLGIELYPHLSCYFRIIPIITTLLANRAIRGTDIDSFCTRITTGVVDTILLPLGRNEGVDIKKLVRGLITKEIFLMPDGLKFKFSKPIQENLVNQVSELIQLELSKRVRLPSAAVEEAKVVAESQNKSAPKLRQEIIEVLKQMLPTVADDSRANLANSIYQKLPDEDEEGSTQHAVEQAIKELKKPDPIIDAIENYKKTGKNFISDLTRIIGRIIIEFNKGVPTGISKQALTVATAVTRIVPPAQVTVSPASSGATFPLAHALKPTLASSVEKKSDEIRRERAKFSEKLVVNIGEKEIHLKGLTEINIILGRNGCGKSRLLQAIAGKFEKVTYIPPERGARPKDKEEAFDHERSSSSDFLRNENINFRKKTFISISRYSFPELISSLSSNFDYVTSFFDSINAILENIDVRIPTTVTTRIEHQEPTPIREPLPALSSPIAPEKSCIWRGQTPAAEGEQEIRATGELLTEQQGTSLELDDCRWPLSPGDYYTYRPAKPTLKFYLKYTDTEITPDKISSGEVELISLWMKILEFFNSGNQFLLLDEPDVHLHPDAQGKVIKYLFELVSQVNKDRVPENKLQVILVTHSTSILSSLSEKPGVSVFFMKKGDEILDFIPLATEQTILEAALPIFGAHPLMQIFNEKPILLVEGIDEDWIWQQAIRSSRGTLTIYPCSVDGESNMAPYEKGILPIINSVYDRPRAYSLRDRDDTTEKSLGVKTIQNLKMFKLHCRSSENLLLSDEVLARYGITFNSLIQKIDDWIECAKRDKSRLLNSPFLQKTLTRMEAFKKFNYNRKTFKIKIKFKQTREKFSIVEHLLCLIREISPINPKPTESWQVAVGNVIGQLILRKTLLPMPTEHSIMEYLGIDLGMELYLDVSLWFKVRVIVKNILPNEKIKIGNGDYFCTQIVNQIVNNIFSPVQHNKSVDIRKFIQKLIPKIISSIPDNKECKKIKDFFIAAEQSLINEISRLIEKEKKEKTKHSPPSVPPSSVRIWEGRSVFDSWSSPWPTVPEERLLFPDKRIVDNILKGNNIPDRMIKVFCKNIRETMPLGGWGKVDEKFITELVDSVGNTIFGSNVKFIPVFRSKQKNLVKAIYQVVESVKMKERFMYELQPEIFEDESDKKSRQDKNKLTILSSSGSSKKPIASLTERQVVVKSATQPLLFKDGPFYKKIHELLRKHSVPNDSSEVKLISEFYNTLRHQDEVDEVDPNEIWADAVRTYISEKNQEFYLVVSNILFVEPVISEIKNAFDKQEDLLSLEPTLPIPATMSLYNSSSQSSSSSTFSSSSSDTRPAAGMEPRPREEDEEVDHEEWEKKNEEDEALEVGFESEEAVDNWKFIRSESSNIEPGRNVYVYQIGETHFYLNSKQDKLVQDAADARQPIKNILDLIKKGESAPSSRYASSSSSSSSSSAIGVGGGGGGRVSVPRQLQPKPKPQPSILGPAIVAVAPALTPVPSPASPQPKSQPVAPLSTPALEKTPAKGFTPRVAMDRQNSPLLREIAKDSRTSSAAASQETKITEESVQGALEKLLKDTPSRRILIRNITLSLEERQNDTRIQVTKAIIKAVTGCCKTAGFLSELFNISNDQRGMQELPEIQKAIIEAMIKLVNELTVQAAVKNKGFNP